MVRKIISILLSCMIVFNNGTMLIHAEGDETAYPAEGETDGDYAIDDYGLDDGYGVDEGTTDGSVNNSPEPTEEASKPVVDETETQGDESTGETEIITWGEDSSDTDNNEESDVPSIKYSLIYDDGSEVTDITNSTDLSTEHTITRINVHGENIDPRDITYNVYLSNCGWQEEVHGDTLTENKDDQKIEAFYAKLSDELTQNYDISYRVYISGFGWTAWTKNGEYCGSKDYSLGINSIEIKIESNQIEAYGSDTTLSYYERPSITYNVHMQDYGWLTQVGTSQVCGKVNSGKRLEAFTVNLPSNLLSKGNISIRTHVQDYGWLNPVSSGQTAGTTGQSKRVEALQISLTGELANTYNVVYQVYVDGIGWQTSKKNGETAGTTGQSRTIQAIRILLQYKNGPQLNGFSDSEKIDNMDKYILYQAHVQDYGWMPTVTSYDTAGTTGQSKRVESLKITLSSDLAEMGGVSVRAHVQDYGWLNSVGADAVIGTTGQSKRLEALQISLTGELANKFDIVYRVHVQDIGWQAWKQNGETAGTTGQSKRIEAIQIAIVKKSTLATSNSNRVEVGVDVSSWQGNNIDWNKVSGTASFAIVRAGYRGTSGRVAEDNTAVKNIKGAKSAGLDVGVYFYSMATNIFQAMEEANLACDVVDKAGGGLTLPIYFDMEDSTQSSLSKADKTAIANAFIDTVHNRGYNAGIYSYMYWLRDYMDTSSLRSDSTWVAQYYSQCTYPNKYDIWQYTSTGSVPGIDGNVDMNKRTRA